MAEHRLRIENATIGYDTATISNDISIEIRDNSFTAIIGPNGCGKSTLLRALSRILKPISGTVYLDDHDIFKYKPKQVARKLGLLPQSSLAPPGIKVADLVSRGRAPYQSFIHQWRDTDEAAVKEALEATGLTDISHKLVSELSGGQRQRVWIAMLLAQQTPIMLLDEPTTFLDIAHQYELMELLRDFHNRGKTIVTVLHDLNHAARYASDLVVMHEGAIVSVGTPDEVLTESLLDEVFSLPARVEPDPITATPMVCPLDPRNKDRHEG